MSNGNEFIWALVIGGAYRLSNMAVGALFAWMGYRLFLSGVYEKAGDLKAAWGDKNLVLKQAAPGTFFAMFGTFVICIGLWRGMDVEINLQPHIITNARKSSSLLQANEQNKGTVPSESSTLAKDSSSNKQSEGANPVKKKQDQASSLPASDTKLDSPATTIVEANPPRTDSGGGGAVTLGGRLRMVLSK